MKIAGRISLLFFAAILTVSFQNCAPMESKHFDESELASRSDSNDDENPSSSPSPTATPIATPTPPPGPQPTATPTPTPGQPTATPTPTPTATPTPQPTPTPTPIPTPLPTPPSGNYLPDPTVTGRKLQVCPSGCPYSTLSGAMAAAIDGDTIEIQYGTYNDCALVNKNNLIIRGIMNGSSRPRFTKTCGRKGILVIQGKNILVENLELSNARDTIYTDHNWAGIRFDGAGGANLKVRNCYFHDNDNGILGGGSASATTNTLVVENSIFEKLGRDGYAHGMYIGAETKLFVLRNSLVQSNAYDGHLVKTRAQQSIIECNTIASLNGENSFVIDFPNGGRGTIRSNVLHQGPNINNSGNVLIQFAGENTNNAPHKVELTSNYIVNDYPVQPKIRFNTATDTSGWSKNIFVGFGGAVSMTGYTGANSFTNYNTRDAAGLPAYNGALSSLPNPPVCP